MFEQVRQPMSDIVNLSDAREFALKQANSAADIVAMVGNDF